MDKERPIIFSPSMVQSILDGKKTQTRRVMKVQPPEKDCKIGTITSSIRTSEIGKYKWHSRARCFSPAFTCPYGSINDTLYVRETWKPYSWDLMGHVGFLFKDGTTHFVDNGAFPDDEGREESFYCNLADELEDAGCPHGEEDSFINPSEFLKWRPSIHMPKNASRIKLEVRGIRVERLHEISITDCIAEGMDINSKVYPRDQFELLWDSINGEKSWKDNPWVWVIEFKVKSVQSVRKEVDHGH